MASSGTNERQHNARTRGPARGTQQSAARDARPARHKKIRRTKYWIQEFLSMTNDLAKRNHNGLPRRSCAAAKAGEFRRADYWKRRSSRGINPLGMARPAEPRARARRSHKGLPRRSALRAKAGWTPERRAHQAALIHRWQPWLRSTGPKTAAGKARVARNPLRHGQRGRAWILQAKRIRRAIRLCAQTVLLVRACAREQERLALLQSVQRAEDCGQQRLHSHLTAMRSANGVHGPSGGTLYALTPPT